MNVYAWGTRSNEIRLELHDDLKMLVDVTLDITPFDLTLTEGHRGQVAQTEFYASGASKVSWPNSKHNREPSHAVHIDPYPINYTNWLAYYVLAGVVLAAAKRIGSDEVVRWGGDWDRDFNFNEEDFRDLAHWELK